MKFLVVGAQGFLGRALCERLEADGHEVQRSSSRDGTGLDPVSGLPGPGWRLVPGTDAIAFLAQSPRHRDGLAGAPHLVNVNVAAPVAVAAAAVEAGVRRIVYTSTGNVYAPSFTPLEESAPVRRDDLYALTKVHAEESLRLFDTALGVHVVRLFGIFGPGQVDRLVPHLYASVLADRALRVDPAPGESGEPDGLRLSLCYVDDAVRVMARLLEYGGPPCLNVAAPEIWSIRRLGQALGRLAGRPVRFETGEQSRRGDLVADISQLVRFAGAEFVSIEEGLARALSCDGR